MVIITNKQNFLWMDKNKLQFSDAPDYTIYEKKSSQEDFIENMASKMPLCLQTLGEIYHLKMHTRKIIQRSSVFRDLTIVGITADIPSYVHKSE